MNFFRMFHNFHIFSNLREIPILRSLRRDTPPLTVKDLGKLQESVIRVANDTSRCIQSNVFLL